MAQIKEPAPVAPVLPTGTGNTLRRGTPRQQQQPKDPDKHPPRHPDPDDGHHLDEYA